MLSCLMAGQWYDLVIASVLHDGTVTAAPRVEAYASNFIPLWAGLAEAGSPEALAAVQAMKASVCRRTAFSAARVNVAVEDPLPLLCMCTMPRKAWWPDRSCWARLASQRLRGTPASNGTTQTHGHRCRT